MGEKEEEMSLKHLPLTLIVAATPSNGIGFKGALPWPMLKKEMAYFARVTKRLPPPSPPSPVADAAATTTSTKTDASGTTPTATGPERQNVVIMGRKTWLSIPPRFRPLKGRTNVVISSLDRGSLEGVTDEVLVAPGIEAGLDMLGRWVVRGKAMPPGSGFVIGGAGIYAAALELPRVKAILLTRIRSEYVCDTVFPVGLGGDGQGDGWRREGRGVLEEFVGESVEEGGIVEVVEGEEEVRYEFQLWRRG
ncbi:hypothetical protein LTR62_002878 [Meristemomyces frigidus]|uniref:Dihydrofolate reductase n=1 Tax=Meristemomyces frigidus TaxID=1508187 RepID=A0AAN7TJQ8_9PEZI|nr:hypothetical protein LTR62_002878 [Meristemomyces frigidus]